MQAQRQRVERKARFRRFARPPRASAAPAGARRSMIRMPARLNSAKPPNRITPTRSPFAIMCEADHRKNAHSSGCRVSASTPGAAASAAPPRNETDAGLGRVAAAASSRQAGSIAASGTAASAGPGDHSPT